MGALLGLGVNYIFNIMSGAAVSSRTVRMLLPSCLIDAVMDFSKHRQPKLCSLYTPYQTALLFSKSWIERNVPLLQALQATDVSRRVTGLTPGVPSCRSSMTDGFAFQSRLYVLRRGKGQCFPFRRVFRDMS